VPVWVPALVGLVALGHLWSGVRDRVCALLDAPVLVRATAYTGMVAALVTLGAGGGQPFIYFAF